MRQQYFQIDPLRMVWNVFCRLFPNTPFVLEWTDDLHKQDGDPWGQAFIPDDNGDTPVVSIDVATPVRGAVEVLAHELAHVAVYDLGLNELQDDDHGKHWEEILDKINEEYHVEFERQIELAPVVFVAQF